MSMPIALPPPGRALAEILKQWIRARGECFLMGVWYHEGICGTVCCIGGEAEIMLGWPLRSNSDKIFEIVFGRRDANLCFGLFFPDGEDGSDQWGHLNSDLIDRLPSAERAEMACAAIDRTCELLGLPELEVANAE